MDHGEQHIGRKVVIVYDNLWVHDLDNWMEEYDDDDDMIQAEPGRIYTITDSFGYEGMYVLEDGEDLIVLDWECIDDGDIVFVQPFEYEVRAKVQEILEGMAVYIDEQLTTS